MKMNMIGGRMIRMTRDEAVQILSILKAAYPNNYKGMSKQEAMGVISLWALHFANVPADIVMIAVNKTIAKKSFPPSIADVKESLNSMYYEAVAYLLTEGTDESLKCDLERIAFNCRNVTEPDITGLIRDQKQRREQRLEAHDQQQGYMPLL